MGDDTPAKQTTPSRPRVPRFTVARLTEEPAILGLTTPVLAAAFAEHDAADELTLAEARKVVTKSQERVVEQDPNETEEA